MIASAVRSAAKVDWTKLSVSLPQETVASLQAFRKRNEEVKRVLDELKNQPTAVDFAHYRSTLKNQKIVDQAEKALKDFKPVTYNLDAQLKAIDQFQAKADLQATLSNIQNSRPIEQLTVDDIITAKPDLPQLVEKNVQEGKYTVPGYKEKFGDMSYF
ncbi:hypothetical protein [Absidia glauca]|uniref:ATP synthase subunit d, mitochondrial n=1 Tax=Absidia glauca TaxID=4829 RepID=A0A163JQU6_ABSGL|nr:hypothetical protein [Absidia glauca]